MAFRHVMRHHILVPRSNFHYVAHQSVNPALQSLFSRTSVKLDCYHQQSTTFFMRKMSLLSCIQNGHLEQSKHRQAISTTGNTYPTDKSTFTLTSMKDSSLGLNFSTSASRSIEKNSIGNVKSSKQSIFHFFSLRSLVSTPAPFMLYGLSGLIPFASMPLYMFMTSTYCSSLAHAQLAYGACILSFLGGVAWGKDLNTSEKATLKTLGYSVFLPLVGWLGVFVYPSVTAFPIVISGIAFAGYVDTQMNNYPQWFKNVRFLLSSLVLISLTSTFLFKFIYADSSEIKD